MHKTLDYTYDFDSYQDRTEFHALKCKQMHDIAQAQSIELKDDVLPFWVADMDFRAPTELTDAFSKLVQHGIFGYANVPREHAVLASRWLEDTHKWKVNPEDIFFSAGVVYAVLSTLLACTEPGDDVLICQPVYGPLSEIVKLHHRNLIVNELITDKNQMYIDFEKLASQITPRTKMFILCNPHNPGGHLWTEKELETIAEICLKHDILICSDDIHSDLIFSGQKYIPIASLSEEVAQKTITYLSPSKTFNLGGQKISHTHTQNQELFQKISHAHYSIWGNQPFTNFGITAFQTVYEQGHTWYRELLCYLEANRDYAISFIQDNIPSIKTINPEAGYLLWLDCRDISSDDAYLMKIFVEDARIFLSQGSFFGTSGSGFMRLNFACPRHILEEGLQRLKKTCSK